MPKRIAINGCIGCRMCVQICPEIFDLDSTNHAYNLYGDDSDIPEDLEDSVDFAIDSCPVEAINYANPKD